MPHFECLYGVGGQEIRFFLADYTEPKDPATPTFASGDAKVAIDGGTPSNATNLPSMVNGRCLWTPAAAELQGKTVELLLVDQDGPAWVEPDVTIQTYGDELSYHNRRNPEVLLWTTVASVTSQTELVLTTGPNDNNTLQDCVAAVIDMTSPDSPPDRGFAMIKNYTGASTLAELANAMPFTVASGDILIAFPTADVASAAEIAAALIATVLTLPGQEAPPLAPTVEQVLGWLFKSFRNTKRQTTAGAWELLADDDSTIDAKAAITDLSGVTTKGKITSGP